MNARLYDPALGRFLSPDPVIQDATNRQNFNRYSYCLNNPFKYTDPSGNNPLLAAIFIGAWINVTINGIQGNINSAGDFWLSMGVGRLSGLAGYGAGQAVSSIVTIGGFANGAIVGAAGGAAGGFVSNSGNAWMNGASIGDGLISGFKGTGIGALTGSIMGGLAKGIDAAANQASFWDGHEDLDLSNGIGAHNIKDNLNAARGYYKGKFEGIRIFESKELGTYTESANGWSNHIEIDNRTDSAIYVYVTLSDTMNVSNPLFLFEKRKWAGTEEYISPDYRVNAYSIGSIGTFETVSLINNSQDDKIRLFFIKEYIMKKYTWEQICKAKLYEQKMAFTKEQLEIMKWQIVYPSVRYRL